MQRQNITKERNQSPCLLRVPAPESAPGIICPDSTENCACGEQQDAQLKHAIEPEMHWRVRARSGRIPRVSPEQNVSEAHCQRESRITQSDGKHVNCEPEIITQHRDQRVDA